MFTRAPLAKAAAAANKAPKAKPKPESFSTEETLEAGSRGFSYSLAGIRMFAGGEESELSRVWNRTPPLAWPIQAKLQIGSVSDPLEAEADRVADQVMGTPKADSPPILSSGASALRRKCDCGGTCDKCKEKDEHEEQAQLRRKTAGPGTPRRVEAPAIVHEVLRSPGQPLDAATRAFMEPRFGWDFGGVRVHADGEAARSAQAVQARAYTVGGEIAFGSGQYAPATPTGQRLLAHELTHVVQQNAGTRTLQRSPHETDESAAEALVEKYHLSRSSYSPFADLKTNSKLLSDELYYRYMKQHRYKFIREAFKHIMDEWEDDVALALLVGNYTALDEAASTSDGRALLDVLYDALITGVVRDEEREQANRLLEAKAKHVDVREQGVIAKDLKNPLVFALKNQPFFGDCYATMRAELLPTGRVNAFYDTYRPTSKGRCPEFWPDAKTILDRFGEYKTLHGFELDPDEIVFVKLYDQSEAPTPIPVTAIQLIDFANQQKEDTLGKIKAVSALAATVGLGGLGVGGLLEVADTVAFAINAGSLAVNEFRNVIAKTAFGREFLEVWDFTEKITEYYGWARLGVDGLRAVHSRVRPALAKWRGEAPPKALSAAEQKTIQVVQGKTQDWVSAVEQAEVKEAEKYLAEHPPKEIKGKPGSRHAEIEGNHAVLELPNGTCNFFSKPTVVECPWAPRKTKPSSKEAPKPKGRGGGSALQGRQAETRFIEALKEKYPKLKNLDIRPKARPSASRTEGAPESSFEERMQTTQGKYSVVVYGEPEQVVMKVRKKVEVGGKKKTVVTEEPRVVRYQVIEFDGISVDGWIEEIKIEQRLHKVEDIVTQLRKQADFAEAYGLKGVRYSIEAGDVADEVEAEVVRQKMHNVHRVP